MNKLSAFMNVAYRTETHSSGTAHFFNDTEFFREYYALVLGKDQDVIDLGFNIGIQAELLLALTSGKVFGFEASRRIYEHAAERFAGQGRVQLFNVAVADRSGFAEFIDTDHWGAGSLKHTAGMDHCGVGEHFLRTEVELARLDDLLPDADNIGLIKLDIEGAELSAMEGAKTLIRRNRPWMVMEYCHNALSFEFRGQPISSRTLYDYAREIDYKVYNIFGICLSNPVVWDASILKDTADVFLIPAEKHALWAEQLLPVYQYRIYDKLLAEIEWPPKHESHYALGALPSRIYEFVNHHDNKESRHFLATIGAQLRARLADSAPIHENTDLSHRGKVLLALLHANLTDDACRLAAMVDLRPGTLEDFARLLAEN
ncbi:MAG: FkbM family methyltransferase [Azonexus sp.]